MVLSKSIDLELRLIQYKSYQNKMKVGKIMKKNNLFNFATSELSQDAFICWLMNFAHASHLKEEPVITECAKKLLSRIIQTNEDYIVTRITRQYKNIDVLIEVNDKYNIIIEDKTFTGQHGDQINNYTEILENENRKNIICVYYKIVEQCHEERNVINITRKDLLGLFSEYVHRTDNIIFRNYYEYLVSIDVSVNSYKTEPIENWGRGHAYKGFFTHLIRDGVIRVDRHYGWQYVSNKAGGMQALYWYNLTKPELDACNLSEQYISSVYLQIEDNIIAVKVTGNTEHTYGVRWSIYNYIKNLVPDFKKKTFRTGQWMTVGYIEYDENDYLDKIALMQDVMKSFIERKYQYSAV